MTTPDPRQIGCGGWTPPIQPAEEKADATACSAAPAKFPVNPERDENGNAVLYPGMTRFEGVAGLYNTAEGEVVILAPTFEALETHVRKMGVSDEISRDRCILSTWSRLPNVTTHTPGADEKPLK